MMLLIRLCPPISLLGIALLAVAFPHAPAHAVTQSTFAWEVSPINPPVGYRFSRGPFTLRQPGPEGTTLRVRAIVDWDAIPFAFLSTFRFDGVVTGASPGDRISNFSIGGLRSGQLPVATYFPDRRTFAIDYGDALPPGQGNTWYTVLAGPTHNNRFTWGGVSVLEFDYTFDDTPGTRTFGQEFLTLGTPPPGHYISFLGEGSDPVAVYLPPTTLHEAHVTVLPAPATLLGLLPLALAPGRRR